MQIYELLSKVMEEVGAVAKREKNQAQGFNFRGIDAVVNAVSPALRKNHIIVVPMLESETYETVTVGRNNTQMGHCRVKVRYTFFAPDGSCVSAIVAAESMDSGDKATAKAMSVAFRTALLQTLCLPTDDIDPDAESYERAPKQTTKVVPKQFPEEQRNHEPSKNIVRMEQQPTGKAAHPSNLASKALVTAVERLAKTQGDPVEVVSDIIGRTIGALTEMSSDDAKTAINNLNERKQ